VPLPPDYADECLYTSDAWFVHDLVSVDAAHVRAMLDTTRIGPLVDAQRPWPGHEKHLPGAVAIQITGTLGSLHAVYGLGLRGTEGWFGYGTHIKSAKFSKLGRIGPPVELLLEAKRVRRIRSTVFVEYAFAYSQDGDVIYTSEQTAAWARSEHRGPCPA
jgi:hypothetical protein